jgi:hypothetical protein
VWSSDGRFVAFWLHRQVRPITPREGTSVVEPGDIEDRHGLVDLQGKRVFILSDGYWGHVSWQPVGA